ncbi:MAG: urease accessory protein UreF [Burkholderiaceae bacterium]
MTTGTTMDTPTAESVIRDAALLRLLWLASPALPVGGFSYSEGLEAAVEAGLVSDEASAAAWISDQIHLGLARSELPVIVQALRAWRHDDLDRVRTLNDWVLQTRETREMRLQCEQMGRSLLEWARSLGDLGQGLGDRLQSAQLDPPTYPVACACALAASPCDEREALVSFAFGWSENLVQAAIKAIPLGQSAGQRTLARLAGQIPLAVDHALSLPEDGRQAFTPGLAILSARHESQYSRLFRS